MEPSPAKFDEYAHQYKELHNKNIAITGEDSDFFAEYKIVDLQALAARNGLPNVRTIVDFGGGIGKSIPFIRKSFPQSKIICMDVSPESLAVAEQSYGTDAEYVLFDGTSIPDVGTVDVAFAACVFHHIDAAKHVTLLAQLRERLGRPGLLAIYEHNPWNPLTRWAVNRCEFDDDAVLISGPEMRRRLARAGFSSPRTEYRVFFPGQLAALRFLEPSLAQVPLGAQYVAYGVAR